MSQRLAVIAHGVGARGDLPLPLYLFSWALGLALLISFVALAFLWPEPRLRTLARGRHLLSVGPTARRIVALVGLALYGAALAAGSFGDNVVSQNLLPVTLYVTVWVGAQLAAGLIGDVWSPLNPIGTIAGFFDPGREASTEADRGPDWGHWPATAGLLIFLFYELSHPTGSRPRTLALLLTAHLFGALIATGLWGAGWVRRNEPFTALFRSLAHMGPVYGDQGRLRLRAPLSGLSTMSVRGGTTVMLLTVIGGTSFDGFSESSIGRDVFDGLSGWTLAGWEVLGLLVSIAVVAALYGFGVWWTARVTPLDLPRTWRAFAPSLVPIAFGYTTAHYFQLFADNIQVFVFRLSDPFGWGWNLFGTADGLIWQIDPDITAWVQVAAMLVGHVGAITVAHDRAVELFPGRESMRSQLAMVFVMIAYSSLGLWLLLTA